MDLDNNSDFSNVTNDIFYITNDISNVTNDISNVTNDIFYITNDIFNITNDISDITNFTNDTLSNSTLWEFNKTVHHNFSQLQFTDFRYNKFHKHVSLLANILY